MSSPKNDSVKIVVVGDAGVGKTAMILRLTSNSYTEDFKATVGADFSSHWVDIPANDGTTCIKRAQLHIWDTAGQERYRSLSLSYFKGCEAAIIVYDLTNAESFWKLSYWLDEVLRGIGRTTLEGFPVFVVGNKLDMPEDQHKVPMAVCLEETRRRGVPLMTCSAKTGQQVESIFRAAASAALDMREVIRIERAPSVKLASSSVGRYNSPSANRPKKDDGCCK